MVPIFTRFCVLNQEMFKIMEQNRFFNQFLFFIRLCKEVCFTRSNARKGWRQHVNIIRKLTQ